MAGRMSNRERIERMRAEADAARKEREAARAERASRPATARGSSRKADPQPARRVRLVWSVCDQRGDEVRQFPYAKEQEARDEAARLSTETGRPHFVKSSEVPVTSD